MHLSKPQRLNSSRKNAVHWRKAGGLLALLAAGSPVTADIALCPDRAGCRGKNPLVEKIALIQQLGARPRWSPDGQMIVFDRPAGDGFYRVFVMSKDGQNLRNLTEGRAPAPQRSSGNAVFHPSGKLIVFGAEEPRHMAMASKQIGDPGLGIFYNLWATDPEGSFFVRLTDLHAKAHLREPGPITAIVNPLFTPDGKRLIWTERFAGQPTPWGRWRIKSADFVSRRGYVGLENETVLYQPTTGNYVTAMGVLPGGDLVISGNLDGQRESGMDVYRYNPERQTLKNLTNTPDRWEEDASVTAGGRIIFMSNKDSKYVFNPADANWAHQAVTREYYIMDGDGGNMQRLTYFNDPSAPEYIGQRTFPVASNASLDGKYLAATLGVDYGSGPRRENVELKIAVIQFNKPM